ncbi:MAG: TonB-dependent receptor [Candidatus Omnitrophota bacterium]
MKNKLLFPCCIIAVLGYAFPASAGDVDLDPIVVTGSRMALPAGKITSDMTVIAQDRIGASSARTVAGLIEEQTGIHVYSKSTAKTASVDIRGFNDTSTMNVLVLVNGRKVNSIDLSGPDLLQIPLESVERLEIIRGAASVLYGDNAVGGVVNIITKEGQGPVSAEAGAYYGSYGKKGADLEISGSRQDLSYYLYSKQYDNKGYRVNSDVSGEDYDGRFGYRASDSLRFDLFTSWHEDDYGLPGGLSSSELESLGRRGSADPQDFAKTTDRSIHLRAAAAPSPGKDLGELTADVSYRNRDTYAEFGAWDFNTKREIDTYGANLKYTFDRQIFNRDLSFVTGLDYYDTVNDILGSGSNTDDITIGKQDFGAYLFTEWEAFPQFYVNTGGRYQRADYTFDQRSGTPNFVKRRADETVTMLGGKYVYAPGSNAFASVQQTFRFLATDEWYDTWNGLDTGLEQQTGLQYEAGVKHRLSPSAAVGATAYWIELEDEIFFDPNSSFFGQNSNYDTTRRRGIETECRVDLLQWMKARVLTRLEAFAGYTYQEAEFIDGPYDGNTIPMVPRNSASAGIHAQWRGKYSFSLNGRYTGSRFAINDTSNNTATVESYLVFDARLAYELPDFEAYLLVNNIFGEEYDSYVSKSASSSTKDFYPAPERGLLAGVRITF